MPIVEADFGKDYEDKPVPEGKYDLRIRDAKDQKSKDGATQILCMIDIEGEEGSGTIFHYLTLPTKNDDDKKTRDKMRFIARFLALFDISYDKDGFNTEDLPGSTASDVSLTQDEYEGRLSNNIVLPAVAH